MKWMLLGLWVLAGCAAGGELTTGSPPPLEPPDAQAVLAALPRCEPGAEVGALTVKASVCTKRRCREACCNRCSWSATFETKNAQVQPADPARVGEVLRLSDSPMDCEVAAWAQALQGQSVGLDAPACVVR